MIKAVKTCSCGSDKTVPGCKSNGGCSTGGCNKMNTYDWLADMNLSVENQLDILEVRFKNGRKEYFRNADKKTYITGDAVVVEVLPSGHHIGYISLQGELVRLQLMKRNLSVRDEFPKVYRIASARDMEKWNEAKNRESMVLYRTREIIQQMKLSMKLSDVEFQADHTKATFYYSADDRVDFRELIKVLASEFKIRVDMRQISLRQEAGRIGGIGICGRELCCSTWLTDFKNVTTAAARYQNLSLNPAKLSGQCGRLKCCLNYELDTYMEALRDIPEVEKPLQTLKGEVKLQKTDIFRKIMWFSYAGDDNWVAVPTERVQAILALNAQGKSPASLEKDLPDEKLSVAELNSDLLQLDKKLKKNQKKNFFRQQHKRTQKNQGNNPKNS